MDAAWEFLTVVRWVLMVPLVVMFLGTTAMNYWIVWGWLRRTGSRVSIQPFAAGISGWLALYVCPVEGSLAYWWVPILLDPGTGLILPFAVYAIGHDLIRYGPPEPHCRDCYNRITLEFKQERDESDGESPWMSEIFPKLVDGTCPVCGGARGKKSGWFW